MHAINGVQECVFLFCSHPVNTSDNISTWCLRRRTSKISYLITKQITHGLCDNFKSVLLAFHRYNSVCVSDIIQELGMTNDGLEIQGLSLAVYSNIYNFINEGAALPLNYTSDSMKVCKGKQETILDIIITNLPYDEIIFVLSATFHVVEIFFFNSSFKTSCIVIVYVKASYGVSVVGRISDLYSVSVTRVLYATSSFIEPHYNDTRLHIDLCIDSGVQCVHSMQS